MLYIFIPPTLQVVYLKAELILEGTKKTLTQTHHTLAVVTQGDRSTLPQWWALLGEGKGPFKKHMFVVDCQ